MNVEDLLGRYQRPRGEATVTFGDEKVTFVIEAVSGDRYDEIKATNPPTEQDWDRFQRVARARPLISLAVPDIHLATAIPLLLGEGVISVDSVAVKWTAEDGVKLWAALSDGDRAELQQVVWSVNNEVDDRPLSQPATEKIDGSASGLITAPSEESHIQRSVVETTDPSLQDSTVTLLKSG